MERSEAAERECIQSRERAEAEGAERREAEGDSDDDDDGRPASRGGGDEERREDENSAPSTLRDGHHGDGGDGGERRESLPTEAGGEGDTGASVGTVLPPKPQRPPASFASLTMGVSEYEDKLMGQLRELEAKAEAQRAAPRERDATGKHFRSKLATERAVEWRNRYFQRRMKQDLQTLANKRKPPGEREREELSGIPKQMTFPGDDIPYKDSQIATVNSGVTPLQLLRNDCGPVCLDLSNSGLTEYTVQPLLVALEGNTHLEQLIVDTVPLSQEGVEVLCRAIQKHPKLARLSVRKCQLNEICAKMLLGALQETARIRELHIEMNPRINTSTRNSLCYQVQLNTMAAIREQGA